MRINLITGNRNEVLGLKDGKVLNEKQLDNFREILTQEKGIINWKK